MISYSAVNDFEPDNWSELVKWITTTITEENYQTDYVDYIFCDDNYLGKINYKYLKHKTLTDIITFNYNDGNLISGDIFISIERVRENANAYSDSFRNELHRVMIHGVLHLCGYNDKTNDEKAIMRQKEDYYLSLRTF